MIYPEAWSNSKSGSTEVPKTGKNYQSLSDDTVAHSKSNSHGLAARMVNPKMQMLIFLTFVSALCYYIFLYFQENHELVSKLSNLQVKYKRSQSESSKYERKYKTSHSNEKLYMQSNQQLKFNLAKSEKHLAETVSKANAMKLKFTDAHLFYKEVKEVLGMSTELHDSENDKKVEPSIVKAVKEKLEQWKSQLGILKTLEKNYTELLKRHDHIYAVHNYSKDKISSLQKVGANLLNENLKVKKMYDDLAVNYKNITKLYKTHSDVNNRLRNQVKELKHLAPVESSEKADVKSPEVKPVEGGLHAEAASKLGEAKTKLTSIISHVKDKFTAKVDENIRKILRNESVAKKSKSSDSVAKKSKSSDSVAKKSKSDDSVTKKDKPSGKVTHKKDGIIIEGSVSTSEDKHSSSEGAKGKPNPVSPNNNKSSKPLKDVGNIKKPPKPPSVAATAPSPHTNEEDEEEEEEDEEVREHVASEKKNDIGPSLDEEQKYEPEHINDILDERGLSVKGTAN